MLACRNPIDRIPKVFRNTPKLCAYDTIDGAKASAIIYSIAETAKANNLKPYDYFEHLLTVMPEHMDDKNTDFLQDLLPWSEKLPENCRKSN